MNIFKKLSPHGAILIANMFFVFYGIDRVNTAMNFINNGYTKALLLILSLLCAFNLLRLFQHDSRRSGNALARLIPMGLNALLAVTTLIILLVDLCLGNRGMPFLNEFVKLLMLLLCITAWIVSARLIAAERRAIRAAMNRRRAAPARRPAPRYSADSYARRDYSGYNRPMPPRRPAPRYDDRDLQGYSGRFAPDPNTRSDLRYSRDNRTGQPNRYPRSTR